MDSAKIQERTDVLKQEINKLLIDYVRETNLPVEAMQALAVTATEVGGEENKLLHYKVDIGVRL